MDSAVVPTKDAAPEHGAPFRVAAVYGRVVSVIALVIATILALFLVALGMGSRGSQYAQDASEQVPLLNQVVGATGSSTMLVVSGLALFGYVLASTVATFKHPWYAASVGSISAATTAAGML